MAADSPRPNKQFQPFVATLALHEDILLATSEIDVAPVSVVRACLVAWEEPATAVFAFLFDEVLPFFPVVVFFFEVMMTMHWGCEYVVEGEKCKIKCWVLIRWLLNTHIQSELKL
jgi:hypothetical protein